MSSSAAKRGSCSAAEIKQFLVIAGTGRLHMCLRSVTETLNSAASGAAGLLSEPAASATRRDRPLAHPRLNSLATVVRLNFGLRPFAAGRRRDAAFDAVVSGRGFQFGETE
jgi:hypothetical protein